jgi:glycine/D-amino acid oxidase-like deaminating enzyme/nitrite reductase/ring-hydroxylating ferredoxin subunit
VTISGTVFAFIPVNNSVMETTISKTKPGRRTSGSNATFWIDSTEPLNFEKLDENLDVDVVIVGGGIAGISIAYNLTRAGKTVALVEDGCIGSGETGRTSAHLTAVLDDRYFHLKKLYGKEKVKLIAESHKKAIDFIEMVINTETIKCEFQRVYGYLFLHPEDKPETLQKELDAACEAGLEVIELVDVPGIKNVPGPCLRFSNQAQFHPLKYIKALAKAIINNGGKIFTDTHAAEITDKGIVSADGYTITARHVVIATNSPVNNKYLLNLRQYPYRSYLIGARIKKDSIQPGLWWDTGAKKSASFAPYHYVRLQQYDEDYDLLLCGGEDHATGLSDATEIPLEADRYGVLESWMREKFQAEDIIYKWSGQVIYPFDSLAYIGRNPHDKENVYIVTGDSGNGLTYGTIAGMLISDLICGKENKYETIYSPSRFKLKAANVFIEEFVGGLAAYVKKKPRHPQDTLETIPKGEGRIIELNGTKYGAYRDEGNLLHIVSAECMHQGCIIKWNNDEKTWDCPCHGSRYSSKGEVLNGPANKNLNYHKIHASDLAENAEPGLNHKP